MNVALEILTGLALGIPAGVLLAWAIATGWPDEHNYFWWAFYGKRKP